MRQPDLLRVLGGVDRYVPGITLPDGSPLPTPVLRASGWAATGGSSFSVRVLLAFAPHACGGYWLWGSALVRLAPALSGHSIMMARTRSPDGALNPAVLVLELLREAEGTTCCAAAALGTLHRSSESLCETPTPLQYFTCRGALAQDLHQPH